MKKSSKVLATILAAAMCLSMAGCGSSQETQEATTAAETTAEATEETAPETETAEESTEEAAPVNEAGVEGKTMPNGVTYYFEDVDTLYVGSYGGTYDAALQLVADRFTEDTGVKVVFDSSWSFSKLVSENHHPSVGVCCADDVRLAESYVMGDDAVYEVLDSAKVPTMSELYDSAIDKYTNSPVIHWGKYGIAYRADLVETAPTSWADLWNEEYAGKVTINPLSGTGGTQFFIQSIMMNGGSYEDPQPGWDALTELAQNSLLCVTSTTATLTQELTDGSVIIAPWWDGRTNALAETGVDVKFVTPEEGAYATITTMSIPVGSETPELAYYFIDLCCDAELQKAMTPIIGYGPTNKNTVLDEETASKVLYGEDEVSKLIFCDWVAVAENLSDRNDIFMEKIAPLCGTAE